MALRNVQGLVQRVATLDDGYVMAVWLAAHTPVADWYAEVQLPEGASAEVGPDTRQDGLRLAPVAGQISAGPGRVGHGVVWLRVSGTDQAPRAVRVCARTREGDGVVEMAAPRVTDPRRRANATATEDSWPGSGRISRATYGAGSGGGGGGGGGGQCELFIDFTNGIVRHRTDAGGGGGSGGGGQQSYYTGRKWQ